MEDIGAKLVPVLTPIIQRVTAIVEKISAWMQANPTLVIQLTGIAVALAGLIAAVGTLGLVLPVIITGFTLLASPIGIVIGLLGVIGTTIAYLALNWEKHWTNMKEVALGKIQSILNAFTRMKEIVSKPVQIVSNAASSVISNVKSLLGREHGGIVPGPVGQPVPIMAHGQERIYPRLFVPWGESSNHHELQL